MPRDQATRWFKEVLPKMADLLLRLPFLLETHYQSSDETGLRLLESQQSGLVLLSQVCSYSPRVKDVLFFSLSVCLKYVSEIWYIVLFQELIAALLACSFFCLFPDNDRGANDLPFINFGHLFMYVAIRSIILTSFICNIVQLEFLRDMKFKDIILCKLSSLLYVLGLNV